MRGGVAKNQDFEGILTKKHQQTRRCTRQEPVYACKTFFPKIAAMDVRWSRSLLHALHGLGALRALHGFDAFHVLHGFGGLHVFDDIGVASVLLGAFFE